MKALKNRQNFLAEEFHLKDIQINKANYEGVLKIRRWRFIMNIPGIGSRIKDEATIDVHDTFFVFINNAFVLDEEGFFVEPLSN